MKTCPTFKFIKFLTKKWMLDIFALLIKNKEVTFNYLFRNLKGISPRILSKRLKELQELEILKRIEDEKVKYKLTKEGKRLLRTLECLEEWIKEK